MIGTVVWRRLVGPDAAAASSWLLICELPMASVRVDASLGSTLGVVEEEGAS